jgi:hypothetical protein
MKVEVFGIKDHVETQRLLDELASKDIDLEFTSSFIYSDEDRNTPRFGYMAVLGSIPSMVVTHKEGSISFSKWFSGFENCHLFVEELRDKPDVKVIDNTESVRLEELSKVIKITAKQILHILDKYELDPNNVIITTHVENYHYLNPHPLISVFVPKNDLGE